jgi:hypothetical protein
MKYFTFKHGYICLKFDLLLYVYIFGDSLVMKSHCGCTSIELTYLVIYTTVYYTSAVCVHHPIEYCA